MISAKGRNYHQQRAHASWHMGPNVMERYWGLVEAGDILPDDTQQAVGEALDGLNAAIAKAPKINKNNAIGWLLRRPAPSRPIKGLYIWGGVGRGKTMLMDLFFDIAATGRKRRVHFHEFMAETHRRIKKIRERQDEQAGNTISDPVIMAADEIAENTHLLCFDEFAVTDIADAMILGRLLSQLFACGVILVVTSNSAPEDQFANGLNRDHFMKCMDVLKAHMDVMALGSGVDYRMEKLKNDQLYMDSADENVSDAIDRIWHKITHNLPVRERKIDINGRQITIPQTAAGAARFAFDDLCNIPLSGADYLLIARSYHTIIIENIPVMNREQRNPARRFITLIDTLYDQEVKLILSAAAAPDALYIASSGVEAFEFQRTASRLNEMCSNDWPLPHKKDAVQESA